VTVWRTKMKIKKNDRKITSNDWRITNQEKYLFGAIFQKREYKAISSDWDHDHCRFCWAEFNEDPCVGFTEGYYTESRDSWVCENCYNDFKSIFEFKLK